MILANMNQFFDLDDHHRFFTDEPLAVCGNSCAMVQDICYDKAFRIEGDRSVHYGRSPVAATFPARPMAKVPVVAAAVAAVVGSCCWAATRASRGYCIAAPALPTRSRRCGCEP